MSLPTYRDVLVRLDHIARMQLSARRSVRVATHGFRKPKKMRLRAFVWYKVSRAHLLSLL